MKYRRGWTLMAVALALSFVGCSAPNPRCGGFCNPAGITLQAPRVPLPVDPSVTMFTLENGLTCWIRPHATPPGKVGFWMRVGSGSMNERDDQQGLAHFLEHLAFNGTTNFPPGELIKYFESIGLTFGRDQNAFTSTDNTTYQLTLPNCDEATIDKGLLCMADYAFRMLLLEDEVAKESKVVLEEMRARKGSRQRVWDKFRPLMMPGSLAAERSPIGKAEVIAGATRELIHAYYKKWYRPDNTTLIIVGDIDPAVVKPLVVKAFADWKATPNPPKDAAHGIKPYTTTRAAAITDPERTETDVDILVVRPGETQGSVGDMRRQMLDSIGLWIVDRRLNQAVAEGAAPYRNSNYWKGPFYRTLTYCGTDATGKPGDWRPMYTALISGINQARKFGFHAQEIVDAKKNILSGAERSARSAATRAQGAVLRALKGVVDKELNPISAAQNLELTRQMLPTITADEVWATYKKNTTPGPRLYVVTMPERDDLPVPTSEEILAVVKQAEATPVEPYVLKERADALMTTLPTPGTVVDSEEHKETGILSAWLSNGVRVHLRRMTEKKDSVVIRVRIGGGAVRETAANKGITSAAVLPFSWKATENLSTTDIKNLMTGKKVGVGGGTGGDTINLSISGSPEDLEMGLQLAHLLMTEPRIDPVALKMWKEQTIQGLAKARKDASARMKQGYSAALSSNDVRHRWPTNDEVNRVTIPAAEAWLRDALQSGQMEIALVGDIDRDRAIALVLRYFGSLPKRPRVDPSLPKLRKAADLPGPIVRTIAVDAEAPLAVVRLGWRGADWNDTVERRTLSLASKMVGTRLRKVIREEKGLTYSHWSYSSVNTSYNGMSFICSHFTADPEKVADAAKIARGIIEEFAKEGPTDEELATVRLQYSNIIKDSRKKPSWWAGVLCDLTLHGGSLDDIYRAEEQYTGYTREQIMATLKKYILDRNFVQVIALPKKEE
jgi:zinc protease